MLKASVLSEGDEYPDALSYDLIDSLSFNVDSDRVFSVFINDTKSFVFSIYRFSCIQVKDGFSYGFEKVCAVAPNEKVNLNGKFGSMPDNSKTVGYLIVTSFGPNNNLDGARGDLIFLNENNEIQMNSNVIIGGFLKGNKFIMNQFIYKKDPYSYEEIDVFKQRYSTVDYNNLVLIATDSGNNSDFFSYNKHFQRVGVY